MTRRRSSPLGLELVVSVVLALVLLPLLSHGAPVQDSHGDLQRYSEGCYYNYNHYSEGDRILTNEPCLNCTCHNKMLMCYLRVCPFTKPIGQDCTVAKRADQCCPIITCPEVPVDVSHHNNQLTTHSPGTELSIPEKYGCSIDSKFYPEGAQVPSNPNKPCELCYCIRNRTSCLMQECTLHIDGCQPIYNKGSCCPVRYSCDHENELLELEDHSTTTTTIRPTPGYILTSTMTPPVSTDCVHNGDLYADGASITGKNACEHCYCMRGDIVCAVQECEMPTLESGAKTCRALPPAEGECCPSNYVCDDDTVTTEVPSLEELLTTIASKVDSDLHGTVSEEDVQLQEHIDDIIAATEVPDKSAEHVTAEEGSGQSLFTTSAPHESSEEDKKSEEEEEDDSPLITTVSALKETSYETTQASIEKTSTHKTEEGLVNSHISIGQDKEYDSTQAPIEDEIINEDKKEIDTTVAPDTEGIQQVEDEVVPSKDHTIASGLDESTTASPESSSEEDEIENEEATTTSSVELSKPTADEHKPIVDTEATTTTSIEKLDEEETSTSDPIKEEVGLSSLPDEEDEESSSAVPSEQAPAEQTDAQDKIAIDSVEPSTSTESATTPPSYEMVTEGEDSHIFMPEIGDHKTEDIVHDTKPQDEGDITIGAPESDVSDIDDIMKHDELPSITVERTTVHSVVNVEEDIVTKAPYITDQETESKPVTIESEETSTATQDLDEVVTSRPAVEDLQGPVQQEDEIPAIVEDITETSTKPDVQAIHVEASTAFPEKDSGLKDASESEEEDSVTTVSPSKVLVAGTATDQFNSDSTTMAVPTTDNEKTIIKEDNITGHLESGIADSTTTAPSADDSKSPSSEGVSKIQQEQDTADSTASVPSIDDIEASDSDDEEDHVAFEKTTSSPTKTSYVTNYTTVIPSFIGETVSEDDLSNADSTTIAPSTDELEEIKGHPEQTADGTTIPSSVVDSQASILEDKIKGQEDIAADTTTSVPSVDDSETPVSEEEIKIESEQTVDPSTISTFAPDSDEASKKQPEQAADLTTIAPSTTENDKEIKGQSEQTPDSTTLAPFTIESEEEIKKHPVQTTDYTTIAPSTAESDEEIKGHPDHTAYSTTYRPLGPESDEEIIGQPEETVASTTAPSVDESYEEIKGPKQTTDSTTTSALPVKTDEEIEEHQEQISDSSTYAPSLTEFIEDSKEEDSTSSTESYEEIKVQPEQIDDFTTTTTIASVAGDSETTEEAFKEQPGQTTDYSTIPPSISESSEEIKGQPELPTDFTTVASTATDSDSTSAKEEIKGQPEATIDSSTNASITADTDEEIKKQIEQINNASVSDGSQSTIAEEEIIGETEHSADSSTNASVAVDNGEELMKKPEQETTASAGSESTSVEEKIKGQSEQTVNSTTNASMTTRTDEEVKEESEQTTTTPDSDDSEITSSEDEIKVQSEHIADSATISSVAVDTEATNAEEENKEQPETTADSTTISSSPSNIKEGIKGQPQQTSDSITIAASTVLSEDSVKGHAEKTGAETELTASDYTTSTPEHSSDETGQEDILLTTQSSIASADEQSSEVIEDTDGSGEKMQEIIPSAIPGEGDCLVNDRTFVNNATVPTSNECELSCSCISSVVVCEKVKCYEPPYPNNCVLNQASTDRCCPQYICGIDSLAEDQRPTTPEDIEEEEIQVTTLAPTRKYPEHSNSEQESIEPTASTVVAITESEENATGKPEENPIKSVQFDTIKPNTQEDSTKTDQSTLADQITTPSSIDIEMPVITPEEPVSNVKEEEESTEPLFTVDSSTQVSHILDETTLPIVIVKPLLEVTGDFEEPVKAATVPDISTSTMKPSAEGSTNPKEASTEAAVLSEISTIKLTNMDAPSLSSVLESESTESEEVTEVIEQSSNESGLESEEDSQQQVFPTVGDEIPPAGDTTIQHEGDYQKPEIPEDMSHIKVDDPAESHESEESTDNVSEEVTTPPKASGNTILTPIEHSVEYPHKIGNIPEIYNKNEFQTTESSVPKQPLGTLDQSTESQPISSTTAPPTEKDESLAATVAPVFDIEKGETQTSVPVVMEQPTPETAVSGEISEEKNDQIETYNNTQSSEEQPIAGTMLPLSEEGSEEKIDQIKTETSAPPLDEKSTEATVTSVSGDMSEEKIYEEQSIAETVSPISEEESDENKDHLFAQTSAPTFEEQPIVITVAPVAEDVSDEKTDEIPTHTSSPGHIEQSITESVAPISDSESEEKKDQVEAQTSAPAYEEQPIAGTVAPVLAIAGPVAPISAEESDESKDQVEAQTSGPAYVEQPIEVTISPVTSGDSGEMTDEVPATSAPTYGDNSIAVTIVPISGDNSEEPYTTASAFEGKPIAGEESEEKKDQIETQTIAPVVEDKPISGTIVPLSEELEDKNGEIETQTIAPKHPIAETDETISPVEEDEMTSHSTVPTVEEQTTSILENETEDIDSQTIVPVIAEKPLKGIDASSENVYEEDIGSHTNGPISPSISSPTTHEADVDNQTIVPVIAEQPLTATDASSENTSEEDIGSHTNGPISPSTSSPTSHEANTDSQYEEEEIIAETVKPITVDRKPSVQAPHEVQESEADIITAATPVKAVEIEGQLDSTESPAASTTIKVGDSSSDLDTTEVPSVDSTTKIVKSPESSEGTNAPTLFEESTVVPSSIDVSDSKNDNVEGSAQTPAPIEDGTTQSMIEIDSEENINSELPSEESSSVTKVPLSEDKTLLQTETPTYETVYPVDQESVTEVKLVKPATELPSAQTDKPDEYESSTEGESSIESTKAPVVPEVIAMGEIISQPGKPVSDDQVSIDDVSVETLKPITDEITTPTESSLDETALDAVPTTTTQTDKSISSDLPSVEKDSEIPSEGSVTEQEVTQTEPISVPSVHKDEEEYSTVVPVSHDHYTTGKPIEDILAQSASDEEDEHDIAFTTTHSLGVAQTNAPSTSEAPFAPIDSESSIASSEEESKEENIQTEAPKDDVKIQTVAEFVTERVDELTTVLPVLDTREDTSTSSSKEEKGEEYEATTDKIATTPIKHESVETNPVHEIPAVIAEEHPTESAIPSSEKPSVHVEDRFDIDLPKPTVTDEKTIGDEETLLATTVHPLFPHIDLDITTSRPVYNASDKIDDEVDIPESAAPSTSASSSTFAPITEQSTAQSVTSAPTSQYQPPGYGHAPPQYPSYPEDEYTDEDETEVFGPGTCRYGGKLFVSAQQIPRDDPCDFCFCFRSDIICLQQSCPPPISGCHEEPISGFCCPRYECPVSMATVLNITTSTTTTSTTLPPHFLHHAYRGAAEKNGCHINGKSYKVGDQIESASGPCMHCTCGGDGQMKCDPKTCSPEPMLRQMIAVVASRRR